MYTPPDSGIHIHNFRETLETFPLATAQQFNRCSLVYCDTRGRSDFRVEYIRDSEAVAGFWMEAGELDYLFADALHLSDACC